MARSLSELKRIRFSQTETTQGDDNEYYALSKLKKRAKNSGQSIQDSGDYSKLSELKKKANRSGTHENIGQDISDVLTRAEKYIFDSVEKYNSMDFDAFQKNGESVISAGSRIGDELESVRMYVDRNRDIFSDEYREAIGEILDDLTVANKDIGSAYSNIYGTEEYKLYLQMQEETQKLLDYDLSSGQEQIEAIDQQIVNLRSQLKGSYGMDIARPISAEDKQNNYRINAQIDALTQQRSEILQQYNLSKLAQDGAELSGVADPDSSYYDPDFEKYSGYVSKGRDDSWWGKLNSTYMMGFNDLKYEYINGRDNGIRAEILNNVMDVRDKKIFDALDQMNDNEIAIYNYQYERNGKESADRYLESIMDFLLSSDAEQRFTEYEGKTGKELLFGIEAGLDQFDSGVRSFFNFSDDYIPATSTQRLSGYVREDLSDDAKLPSWLGGGSVGQVGYDLIATTANMAPSILTSKLFGWAGLQAGLSNVAAGTLASAAGNTAMFASAAGSAYQEALNLGYGKSQARTYSTLVGGSEAGLQYLLGGISALGGKVSGDTLKKILDGVDKALFRVAGQFAGELISEGVEEGLQEILTPWFKELALYVEEDVNWDDVAYSTLLGMLSAAVPGAFDSVGEGVATYKTGKNLIESDISPQMLAGVGKNLPDNTAAFQLANRVNEHTGAYTTGRLYNEIITSDAGMKAMYDSYKAIDAEMEASAEELPGISRVEDSADSNTIQDSENVRSESRAESSADIGYETTVKEYRAFYDAGYRNASVEDVQWDSGSMTVDQKAAAWQAGYNARNSGIEKGKTTAFVNQGQQGKVIESPEALDFGKQNPTAKKALDRLAKAWGVNIEIGNYGDRINGSIKDGVIRLNAQKFTGENRNQVIARIFAHEITHRMQETAVEDYTRYRDYVLDIYAQNGTLDSVIREFQHRYQDAGETITREEAMDEIASDFTQKFLKDTQLVKDFLAESEENRSWFQKIIDWAKGLVAKLKKNGTKETNALLAEVENALKLWEKAYAEGIKAVKNAPIKVETNNQPSQKSVSTESSGHKKSNYDIILSDQEKAQIRAARISKYTTYNKEMYGIDYVYAHDMCYLIQNFDLDSYIVFKRLNPAAEQEIINYVMEAIDNGKTDYRNVQDSMRSIRSLRSTLQKRSNRNRSASGNRRTAKPVYGLDGNVDEVSDGKRNAGESSENSRSNLKLSVSGTENILSEAEKIAEYSEPDYSYIQEKQSELNQVTKSIKEIESSEGYRKIMDAFNSGNDFDAALEKYTKWREESGYRDLTERKAHLKEELDSLRRNASEYQKNQAIKEEQEAVKKSGLSEADYFRKQAVKEFGYTPYFYDAGYILPNGKMLNFSGEKGKHFGSRGEDHRAIAAIYSDTNGSAALTRFMNDGNIRIMAESPGLDIFSNAQPTSEQYSTIRKFIYEYSDNGYFSVDFSDSNGRTVGSLEYENKVNATRIVNDIKHYFETGEIRSQASVDQFRWSISSTENILQEANEKYGSIEKGEKPARDIKVPRKSSDDQRVSYTIRTALEAGVTPDVLVPKIAQGVISGRFSDEVHTNKKTLAKAKDWIDGFAEPDKALDSWNNIVKDARNILDEQDTVRGYLLYNMLATSASKAENVKEQERYAEKAVEVLTTVANITRANARMVQATRILKRLSPQAQYFSLERAVERLNEQIRSDSAEFRLKKGQKEIVIDKELAGKWLQALHDGNMTAAEQLEERLYKSLAKQVGRTFLDIWRAWRYLSMLGNVKTLTRNLVGNLAVMPAKFIKDKLAAIMDLALPKEERTKAFFINNAKGKVIQEFAKQDFAKVQKLSADDRKYNDYSRQKLMQYIYEEKRKFKAPVFKQWQEATDWVMNGNLIGDSAFMRHHYTVSFTRLAMARGWTVEQIKSGRISQSALDDARGKAYLEAQKATFRDANKFSNMLKKLRFKDKGLGILGNIVVEGILPFKGTPANVLVRAVEYSPVEFIWNITVGTYSVATGKITASEYIERMASGLTGTGICALGAFLAGMGLVTGGDLDDDEERMGYQGYSLNVGGKSYSLDWLSPAAIPFFLGVELYNMLQDKHDGASVISAILDSFQPMLEMSCLSGVQSLLNSGTYVEGTQINQLVYSILVSPFVSYVSQGIPTFLSQLANATEKTGEKTYISDIDDQFDRNVAYSAIKLLEKIPLVNWRQVPRVDAWGRVDEKTSAGDWAEGVFESFVSPSYINDIKVNDADMEIERLQGVFQSQINEVYKQMEKAATYQEKLALQQKVTELQSYMNISPDVASTKIGNVRLTQQQYTTYALEKGKQNYELATALMETSWYKGLSDERKSAAIQQVFDLADAKGQYAAVGIIKTGYDETFITSDTETAIQMVQEKMDSKWTDAAKKESHTVLQEIISENGDASKVLKELRNLGYSDDDIREYSRKYIKELFTGGNIDDTTAVNHLKKYGGLTSSEAVDRATYWKWQKNNPDSAFADGLHEKAALKYERSLKSYGISLSVWETIYKSRHTDEKLKEDVWNDIHKQKLTSKQKDALYYACGYAESGLKNTPWHK